MADTLGPARAAAAAGAEARGPSREAKAPERAAAPNTKRRAAYTRLLGFTAVML